MQAEPSYPLPHQSRFMLLKIVELVREYGFHMDNTIHGAEIGTMFNRLVAVTTTVNAHSRLPMDYTAFCRRGNLEDPRDFQWIGWFHTPGEDEEDRMLRAVPHDMIFRVVDPDEPGVLVPA